jgi:hypothetical protein
MNPSDKQEARKHVETQPGSPNFDGAEAYEAYLNAQSAEQDRIDAELFQRLLHARSELGRAIADPMWADHSEVTKAALKRWHRTIDEVIKGASK